MKIPNRGFIPDELEIISVANDEAVKIGVLAKAALAALSQKATYQIDIDYAKQLLFEIIERSNDE